MGWCKLSSGHFKRQVQREGEEKFHDEQVKKENTRKNSVCILLKEYHTTKNTAFFFYFFLRRGGRHLFHWNEKIEEEKNETSTTNCLTSGEPY